jgi:hypothetical protein
MEPREVPDEWYECLKNGGAALRSPHEQHAAPTVGSPDLVIWHAPSFYPCHSWAFFHERQAGETRVFHLIWRQDLDARSFSGLQTSLSSRPTIEVSTVDFDPLSLMSFLETLQAFDLSLFPREVAIGLDGESFGLRVFHPELELSWWGDGPMRWQQLTSAVTSFIEGLPHDVAG